MAKKKRKFDVEFDMVSDLRLPEYISWQEEEVMYQLAKYFRKRISQGHNKVTMAEIVELFGHIPEPHMYNQIFKIAESINHPASGITHKGKYYPAQNTTLH